MEIVIGDKMYSISGSVIGRIVLVIVVLVLIVSGVYSIDADEVGVIQRFGKYVRKTEPGIHLKIPFGVETVEKVKVKKVFKEEFGFRTVKPGVRTTYSRRDYGGESIVLTGDLNVAEVKWIVQYKIKDPYDFLFKIQDPLETLRTMSEAVMRMIVGDKTVTDVLTVGRIEIAKDVQRDLQDVLDHFNSGMHIVTVKFKHVDPPEKVRDAFNEVNRAKQDREKMVNQAWEEYNRTIPRARGQAEQKIAQAEGYALRRVNQAKGDVALFEEVYNEYRHAPDVTKRRLYLETMNEILPRIKDIYIVDKEQKSILPLLDLGATTKGGGGK
jgi:membrane protease subunit HflK